MKATCQLFWIGVRQMLRDGVLLLLLLVPLLLGGALRVLVPLAISALRATPNYVLSDGILLASTPLLVALVGAFVMLDERDEGVAGYFSVTPAGRRPYLMARLVWPVPCALAASVLLQHWLGLATLSWQVSVAASLLGSVQGVAMAMLTVSLAGNKVEGMAVSKLANLLLVGLPAAWLVPTPLKYVFGFLPSFWIGELLRGAPRVDFRVALTGLVVATIWVAVLLRVFLHRNHP